MTSDFKEQFKRLRSDVRLLEHEKAAIREAIMSTTPATPIASPFTILFAGMPVRAAAVMAVLIVVFTGTSLAAENALPGEALYSLKVSVNERLERAVAFGTVAKAQVDVQHAEERIREVELLAAKGKEDARDLDEITQIVDEHLVRASESARELMKKGDEEKADRVADRINATLLAHADILEAQAENEEDEDRRKLRALSVRLSVAVEERVPEREETDPRDEEYYKRITASRAEEAKDRIEDLHDAISDSKIPEETKAALLAEHAELEARLADANVLALEGNLKDASEAYAKIGEEAYLAYALAVSADRIARETDKEVVVQLEEDTAQAFEAATMMLSTEMATDTKRDMSDAPKLKFIIRDREED